MDVGNQRSEMENGIDYVENQTRRNNLGIDGVAEIAAENWADTEAYSHRQIYHVNIHDYNDKLTFVVCTYYLLCNSIITIKN